jgi:hypothetical protein
VTRSKQAPAPSATDKPRIERADIEAKFRELRGEVDNTAEAAKGALIAVGAAVAIGVVLFAFVLGRKRGKKRTTVVEIRRV